MIFHSYVSLPEGKKETKTVNQTKFAKFLQSWPVHRWDFQIRWPSIKEKSIECLTPQQGDHTELYQVWWSTLAGNLYPRTNSPVLAQKFPTWPVHLPVEKKGAPIAGLREFRLWKNHPLLRKSCFEINDTIGIPKKHKSVLL